MVEKHTEGWNVGRKREMSVYEDLEEDKTDEHY